MKKKWIYGLLVLTVLLALWICWGNAVVTTTVYQIEHDDLPEVFSGFRIAQVSDLHNGAWGKNHNRLLAELTRADPDIIILTGDLVDSRRTDVGASLAFARQTASIAPCYYVTGNHEARLDAALWQELEAGLTDAGVTVLLDQSVQITRKDAFLYLTGAVDPSFGKDTGLAASLPGTGTFSLAAEDGFSVLLSHRPEFFEAYVQAGFDLVFSGHAHGGQVRLPFLGGMIAPNQGLFPEYDAGLFQKGNTTMVVSRGIGNSLFPFRLNNPPELVVAELIAPVSG